MPIIIIQLHGEKCFLKYDNDDDSENVDAAAGDDNDDDHDDYEMRMLIKKHPAYISSRTHPQGRRGKFIDSFRVFMSS